MITSTIYTFQGFEAGQLELVSQIRPEGRVRKPNEGARAVHQFLGSIRVIVGSSRFVVELQSSLHQGQMVMIPGYQCH